VGLKQVSKGVSWRGTGTPLSCYRSSSIVGDERFGVCDGAHGAFVMKKSQRPRPSLRDRTGHPPKPKIAVWGPGFSFVARSC
jgi:hypothetical protein